LSGWSFGYVVANQVALWVVLVLANAHDGGAFAYLAAFAFFQLPHGLFAVSIMTTLTPEMASSAGQGDDAALRDRLSLGLRLVVVVVAPASALLVALARPIIVAFLQRGEFDAAATGLVAPTLALFAVGILPFSVYLLTLRIFYARHDTRTPFLVNCVENLANIALAVPLFAWIGIPGLALAFSCAYVVGAAIALLAARRVLGRIDGRRVGGVALRSLAVAGAIGAVAWATGRAVGYAEPAQALATLLIAGALSVVLFFAGARILRIGEVTVLRSVLTRTRTPEIV
jgi:putative peptidoglycan lipid II flippase